MRHNNRDNKGRFAPAGTIYLSGNLMAVNERRISNTQDRKWYYAIRVKTPVGKPKMLTRKYNSEVEAMGMIMKLAGKYDFVRTDNWGCVYAYNENEKMGYEFMRMYRPILCYYDQKVTVEWKKNKSVLPKEVVVPGDIPSGWSGEPIFDYLDKTYGGKSYKLQWGEIC